MNAAAAKHPFRHETERFTQSALSVVLGAAFTFGLFFAIAHFEKATPDANVSEIEDLRAISIPIQPPPPPSRDVQQVQTQEAAIPLTGLELSPSDSPIKIAVSPPELDFILPPPQTAPPATIISTGLDASFKPSIDVSFDVNHVFQQTEVDRIPTALYREAPSVPSHIRNGADALRVVFLIVINADGSISQVREMKSSGNPYFDALVSETVQAKWAFSPAVRKGKKVRCLIQQAITIKWPSRSRFEL